MASAPTTPDLSSSQPRPAVARRRGFFLASPRGAGPAPSGDEARIASNYLDGDEIYALHVLCEQFLLYVQGQAARGRAMTMRELAGKLDDLLRLDDYPVLPGHKDLHRERAVRHAGAEYARFVLRDPPKPRLGRR